jgi:hypothetical protein
MRLLVYEALPYKACGAGCYGAWCKVCTLVVKIASSGDVMQLSSVLLCFGTVESGINPIHCDG